MSNRPMTTSELLYLVENEINQALSLHLVVEMDSAIHTASLSKAIALANVVNPCANYRAKCSALTASWYPSKMNDHELSIVPYEWDGEDIQSIPFLLNKKFNSEQPTIHISYIQGKRHFIVFRVFHGLMDAMGLYHWVQDIFRAWRDEALVGSSEQITDEYFLINQNKNRYRAYFPFECIPPTKPTLEAHTDYIWYQFKIPSGVNALTAKIAQMLLDECTALGGIKGRFMIPVDLRRYLSGESTTSNFTNPLFIEAHKGANWQSIYCDIVKQLANQNELVIGKFDGHLRYIPRSLLKKLLKLLSRYQIKKNRYMISGIISSLSIDLKDLHSNQNKAIDAFFLPINTLFSPITVISTEHNEATRVCFTISNAHATKEDCAHLANKLSELINLSFAADERSSDTLWPKFNNTVTNIPRNETVFSRIWENMDQFKNQTALISGDVRVSYRRVQERIVTLASLFSSLGIKEGGTVALLLSNNQDNLCCMLACWYLGAAYIPIDIRSPLPWILSVLAHAKPSLTVHDQASRINECYSGLCIDLQIERLGLKAPQMSGGSLSQLAYIIYTSGTTGTPKGVMINHGQLLNYLWWAVDAYQHNHQPYHTALFTCIAFDLTVTTLYLPLMTGGSIRLIDGPINPLKLKNIMSDHAVNCVKLTPSHLRMIRCLHFTSDNRITLIVGGESLSCQLAKSILDKLPASRIFNEYGPTETTVGCMIHLYDPQKDVHGSVPIGIPIANTRIYCLDKQMKPVAIGKEGELYIAGAGVGDGYLHHPQATDSAFLKDPFYPGQRMYKSGDLAMHLNDGLMVYLGRVDQQIKIRGHRIELSAIENALLLIDGVMQAVVIPAAITHLSECDGKELIAYVVSSSELKPELIRSELSLVLPYYMVPRYVICLPEIPMTINGKIDVNQLPAVKCEEISGSNEQSDDLLTHIRQIFANILTLSLNDVAPDSLFQELGGDSMQMAALINELFTKIIPDQFHQVFMNDLELLLVKATPNNVYACVKNLVRDTSSWP